MAKRLLVENILAGSKDDTDQEIQLVYYRNPPLYAVYRTNERVLIQFADDRAREAAQRTAIAPLAPLRGQINSLIDGWRLSPQKKLREKAGRYDRRVADALLIGLETDVALAAKLLEEIKNDLLEERKTWARVLYVLWAAAMVAMLAALSAIVSAFFTYKSSIPNALWLALVIGSVGAFFSIAQGIRNRSVLTDLQMSGNIADAVLRVLIGAISAVVLIALLMSKIAGLTVNGHDLLIDSICSPRNGYDGDIWNTKIMVGAFIAGFLERLVPDLLAKAAATERNAPNPPAPGAGDGGAARAAPPPDHPSSGQPAPPPPPTDGSASLADEGEEDDTENCLAHAPVTDAEATADDQLPAADGGVAK